MTATRRFAAIRARIRERLLSTMESPPGRIVELHLATQVDRSPIHRQGPLRGQKYAFGRSHPNA